MKIEKNKVLVQIGTNDGNDEFNLIAKASLPSKVILVEPNKIHNESIKNHYRDVRNVFVENVAITEVSKGMVKLYIPKNRPEMFNSGNFSLLPMTDWGKDLEEISAPSMTFSELCKLYKINDIHYLQLDTEGYDAEIIKSIPFSRINIDIIKYEDWSFGEECFKQYGRKARLYGINGMVYIQFFLENLGYTIEKIGPDLIATKDE